MKDFSSDQSIRLQGAQIETLPSGSVLREIQAARFLVFVARGDQADLAGPPWVSPILLGEEPCAPVLGRALLVNTRREVVRESVGHALPTRMRPRPTPARNSF